MAGPIATWIEQERARDKAECLDWLRRRLDDTQRKRRQPQIPDDHERLAARERHYRDLIARVG